MSNLEVAGAYFAVLLALIFLRVPIGLAMLVCGIAGSWTILGTSVPIMAQLKTIAFETFSSEGLAIVPLFLLMGQLATRGGMSAGLFRAMQAGFGRLRGGLAMAAVGACAGFGAICGSSLATAATMGQIALPEMRRYGYSDELATGALAAGGTLGILIPPSVILVIYAILTEQNIAKLFAAALVPGLLAALGYIVAVALVVRLREGAAPAVSERPPPMTSRDLLTGVAPIVAIFVIVVGGINTGWFTPNEGAAVGAVATGLAAFSFGGMDLRAFRDALLETAVSTGMIFFIVLGASVFNTFLGFARLPQEAESFVTGLGFSPWIVLILVLLIYLVFGCVMDSLSMILLTVPIFFPMMAALDFGLSPEEFALWFGVIVLIVVEVGLITPPVGMNLFVINSMARAPIGATYRGILPFIVSDMVRVAILLAFPVLTLGLVRLL